MAEVVYTSNGGKTSPEPKQYLTQRVVQGGFWILAVKITGRAARFLSILILARLLAPAEFGVFGIAVLTISFLETLSEIGFEHALIQKKSNIDEFLDTALIISILKGLTIFLVLFFSAPLVADFFESPNSQEVLRVLSFAPLIKGVNNVGMVFFRKELDFKKIFIYQVTETLANVIVAVSMALVLRNVWALVFGLLASRVAALVLSYILHPYRPGLSLDLEKAKQLFAFGKWVLGSRIVLYFINKGGNAFVGKMMGTTSLGFYTLAFQISNLPSTEITSVISKVMFPAYSKLQDDITKLRQAYFRVIQVLALFSMPVTGMIFLLAPDFTKIFLGEKWIPMVPLIQILSISALLRSLSASTGPLFQGVGKPHIVTKLVIMRLAIIAPLIYPFTSRWGMQGTAFTMAISAMAIDPLALYLAASISQNSFRSICKNLLIPFVNTTIVLSLVSLSRPFFLASYKIYGFFGLCIMSIVLYFCLIYFCQRLFNYSIPSFVKKALLQSTLKTVPLT